ncbi:MAG: sulfite exporter TauE/SafE family protein [Acidobacteriota bacterium]
MTTRHSPTTRRVPPWLPPLLLIWGVWLTAMIHGDWWHLFLSHGAMSLTMVFGSFIAGATSEGGGAVAFPVMTLVFGLAPSVARDFSLMIQTVGMNAAAWAIFSQRIPVERRALLWASLGGSMGIIFGLEFIRLPPAFAKIFFVSTWLAFAFALFWLNRVKDREVSSGILEFGPRQRALLLLTGAVGGMITAITGSGLDIATFALLTLRFRVSEKIATPTSVVLMAWNASVGFAWQGLAGTSGLEPEAWRYWAVCIPVVVVGAPLGAWFIKSRSRLFIAGLLYTSIGIQAVWAIFVLDVLSKPTLALFGLGAFIAGLCFFRWMAISGEGRQPHDRPKTPPKILRPHANPGAASS